MKSAQTQLSTYKSVHLNPKNIATHFIGVPLIVLAVTIWLSLTSWEVSISNTAVDISLAMIIFGLISLYYLKLHWRIAIGLIGFLAVTVVVARFATLLGHSALIGLALFVIGWAFQLLGHHFEKAKPAFIDDLNQLLIGPFFLMAELYFALGWEKHLNQAVTQRAIEKRRAHDAKQAVA